MNIKNFDEGNVELTIEDDGRIHCVNYPDCPNVLDVTLAEVDGTGSAPVCAECAGAEGRHG